MHMQKIILFLAILAITFTGYSDSIKIAGSSRIDSAPSINGSTVSVMMWTKFDSTQGSGCFLSVGEADAAGSAALGLWYNPSTNTGNLYNGKNGGGNVSFTLTEDSWTHLAVTSDAANSKVYLYENGQLKYTWTGGGQNAASNAILRLAQDLSGSAQTTNIEYDEVSVWNGNLTQDQIQANYNSGNGNPLKGDEADLLLYWTFEGGGSNSVEGDSAKNVRGLATGVVTKDFIWQDSGVDPKGNRNEGALKIINSGHSIDSAETVDGAAYGMTMWMKVDSNGTRGCFAAVGHAAQASPAAFGFWVTPSSGRVEFWNGVYKSGPNVFPRDKWVHVGIIGSTSSSCKLYIDGQLVWNTGAVQKTVSNVRLTLGRAIDHSAGNECSLVEYDEVALFDKALTEADITANYNSGKGKFYAAGESGLALYWKGEDDPQANTLVDSSGNSRNGTVTGTKDTDFAWTKNYRFKSLTVTSPAARVIWQQNSAGEAAVKLTGYMGAGADSLWVRFTKVDSAKPGSDIGWTEITSSVSGYAYAATVGGVKAGWYTMEVQSRNSGAAVETVSQLLGVGDVYIVGGQSNSANSGQSLGKATEQSVSVFNYHTGRWIHAEDPLPVVFGTGGTAWCQMANFISADREIPLGIASTGIPGTSLVFHSKHVNAPLGLKPNNPPGYWQVDGGSAESSCYFVHMKPTIEALKDTTGFKAILWHQGEMDALWLTTQADYERELKELINKSRTDAGFTVPWYVALASYMDMNNAANNTLIENAQINVINDSGIAEVYRGARTNGFKELGYLYDGAHHNLGGMVEHGKRWASALGTVYLTSGTAGTKSAAIEVMNGADHALQIKQSTDGVNWTDSTVSLETTRDGSTDTFTASVTGLSEGTAYQFKAVYDSGRSSQVLSLTTTSGIAIATPATRTIWQQNAAGKADVTVTGSIGGSAYDTLLVKLTRVDAGGAGADIGWQDITASISGSNYSSTVSDVQAGWYTMSVKLTKGGSDVSETSVLVGVGDVFVTCGQSNAANYGETKGTPAYEYVNAKDFNTGVWQKAADPQPGSTGPNSGAGNDKGSVWPDLGDQLASWSGTPVGFVSCAYGGSSVSEWDPADNGSYYHSLLKPAIASLSATGFKAVIWHQGEADAYNGTTANYQINLEKVIAQSRTDSGHSTLPWGVALAGDYDVANLNNKGQHKVAEVEAAQLAVIAADPYVFRGARTNGFVGLGYVFDKWHFNDAGLLAHAKLWFEALGSVAYDATAVSASGFTANWHETFDAVSYTVVVDDDSDFSSPITTVSSLTGTSAVITKNLPQGSVYYRVIPNNGTRNLAPSASVSFNVAAAPTTAGSAIDFSSNFEDTVIADLSSETGVTQLTFECWMKLPAGVNTSWSFLPMVFAANSNQVGFSTAGADRLCVFCGAGNYFVFKNVFDGKWHHFAVTVDTAASGTAIPAGSNEPARKAVRMYIDGYNVFTEKQQINDRMGRSDFVNASINGSASYPSSFNLTTLNLDSSGWTLQKYGYQFDELRVWTKVRSQAEIRNSMNRTNPENTTGLIAHYKGNGSGDDLVDDIGSYTANSLLTKSNVSRVSSYAHVVDASSVSGWNSPDSIGSGSTFTRNDGGLKLDNATLSSIDYLVETTVNTGASILKSDLPSGTSSRLERQWYLWENGSVSSDLYIDLTGITTDITDPSSTKLLYRATASGNFSSVATANSISGNIVKFSSVALNSGYYTMGSSQVLTPAYGLEVTQEGRSFFWSVNDEVSVKEYRVVNTETGAVIEVVKAENMAGYSVVLPEGVKGKLVVVDNSGMTQSYYPEDGKTNITSYQLQKGWNLIAVTSDNAQLEALKQNSSGVLWSWNGAAYEAVESPEPTMAVWVYADKAVEVTVSGQKISKEITLTQGWNMVGPVTNVKVPAEAHSVFSWNSAYTQVAEKDATLVEGVGYWIFKVK